MVILTQLVKEKGMQNVPTDVDMEKEIIQEVVSEEVIIEAEDHRSRYL